MSNNTSNTIYKMEFGFSEQKLLESNRSIDEIKDKLFRLLTSMGLKRETPNSNTYVGSGTASDRDLFFSSVIFINRAEWLTPFLTLWTITTPDGKKDMTPLLNK